MTRRVNRFFHQHETVSTDEGMVEFAADSMFSVQPEDIPTLIAAIQEVATSIKPAKAATKKK